MSQVPLARPMEWQVPWDRPLVASSYSILGVQGGREHLADGGAQGAPGGEEGPGEGQCRARDRCPRVGPAHLKLSRDMEVSEHQHVPASSQRPEVWPSATQPAVHAQLPKVHLRGEGRPPT